MKKVLFTLALAFSFCIAQSQTTPSTKDTTVKAPVTTEKPADKLTTVLTNAYKAFGEDTGKYLTKAQWDQTMAILSEYLRAAIETYKKEEPKK